MNVKLLAYTPDPERTVACAAKLCYAAADIDTVMEGLTEEKTSSFINMLSELGHESPVEHASFTFAIDGVSRALTHQLVRHRLASFNQQSQRYVKFKDGLPYVKPESIAAVPEADELFEGIMDGVQRAYARMLELGVPAEDARFILPNAVETKIVVTMNARELLHFFELRCCNRAQWEIRELAHRMLELVRPVAPFVFMDAGAPCVRGACPEGKMTCGEPYPRVERA